MSLIYARAVAIALPIVALIGEATIVQYEICVNVEAFGGRELKPPIR